MAYKWFQWTSLRAGLRQPRARLGPLEFEMSDHPVGPVQHARGPAGWQVLQLLQSVTILRHWTHTDPIRVHETVRTVTVRRLNFTPNLS
jgi:hypothetical protein